MTSLDYSTTNESLLDNSINHSIDENVYDTISVCSSENECFICYEDLLKETNEENIYTLPCCKKILHKECLDKWHKDNNGDCKCPHCMTVLYTKISPEDNEQIRLINLNTVNTVNTVNTSLSINNENNDVSYCERYILSCLAMIFCYMCIGTLLSLIAI